MTYAAALQDSDITGKQSALSFTAIAANPDAWFDTDYNGAATITINAPTVGVLNFGAAESNGDLRHFLYDIVHVDPISISSGALSRTRNYPIKVWNAFLTTKSLSAITIPVAGITMDNGTSLPDSFAGLQEITYDLEIAGVGASTFDTTLVLTFNGYTAYLPVDGFRAQLWSYWAQAPLKETLEPEAWIFTATDGTEQRSKIRDIPRRTFSFESLLDYSDWRTAQTLLRERLGVRFIIPVYQEAYFTNTTYTAGSTVITVDTTTADYYAGGLAIIWKSATENFVGDIASVASGSITLSNGLDDTLSGNLRIAPAALVKLNPQVSTTVDPVGNRKVKLSGLAVASGDLSGYTSPVTFDGYDVFTAKPEGTNVNDSYKADMWDTDYDIGVIDFGTMNQRAKLRRGYETTLLTTQELWNFRRFVHTHHNAVPFWVATHEPDCYMYTNLTAGSSSINIVDNGYYQDHEGRLGLFFEYPDGTFSYHTVTTVAFVSSTVTQLTLDAPTTNASTLSPDEVKIGYMVLSRFEGSVSLEHFGHLSQASFKLVEVYA